MRDNRVELALGRAVDTCGVDDEQGLAEAHGLVQALGLGQRQRLSGGGGVDEQAARVRAGGEAEAAGAGPARRRAPARSSSATERRVGECCAVQWRDVMACSWCL